MGVVPSPTLMYLGRLGSHGTESVVSGGLMAKTRGWSAGPSLPRPLGSDSLFTDRVSGHPRTRLAMADGSKRPAQGVLDRSPSTPAPLGALSPLPEVLLAHLCSFLSGRDLARLGGACAALHESPVSMWPRLRVGLRRGLEAEDEEEDEEGRRRRVEALRMLARRAASGLKELRMEDAEVMEAFCSAVREGGQPLRLISSLHVRVPCWLRGELMTDAVKARYQQLVAGVLAAGQLPMLRELVLSTWGVESVLPLWRVVGEGACPRLERINIDDCRSQQLSELAEAMRARPEGCEELRAVSLRLSFGEGQATFEALQALLSRLSPRSLEELILTFLPSESLQATVVSVLASGWAALKTLKLGAQGTPSVDGLLHALARGAMPSLTCLCLWDGTCSDEAWRALGEAMGPEGMCLRRIKTLNLYEVISSPRQLEILCRAMGTGHGCPELEVLDIGCHSRPVEACGAALAPAFRPPHGLPRLKQLLLKDINLTDLDQLVEALQHRPHASQPVEVMRLWECELGDVAVFGQAMAEGGSLARLRELTIESGEEAEEWPMQLVEALAGGAEQQLEKIECRTDQMTIAAVNHLLQGLAISGACPRLQSLTFGTLYGDVVQGQGGPPGQLDACSLGTILAGRAGCSATLREIYLAGSNMANEGVRRLAACLREPHAIQLESFILRAGEPDACEAVMELLSVLGGRAGDRLRFLVVRLLEGEEGDVKRVAEHAVGIIKAGGLPAVGLDQMTSAIIIYASEIESVGADAVKHALRERAQAQWLASW